MPEGQNRPPSCDAGHADFSAGTETAIYAGTHIGFRTPGARYPKYPYLAGYAATGTVLAVGSEVRGIVAVGDPNADVLKCKQQQLLS